MTCPRRDGREDVPFLVWIRSVESLDSVQRSLTVNDCDLMLQKYRVAGSRAFQFHMLVEVKTFNVMPDDTQRETLFDYHQLRGLRVLLSAHSSQYRHVTHWGAFVLSLSGDRPDTSERISWYRFDERGVLHGQDMDYPTLISVLGFDVEPNNLQPMLPLLRPLFASAGY